MIHSETIGYTDGATSLTGVLMQDEDRRVPRPGVLVVHGGAGLDAHARDRAARVAALGFVAFACDMYGDGVIGDRDRTIATLGELTSEAARIRGRARAGLNVLASRADVDGRLAAVGYCFGGMAVLELARSGIDLAAVVSVHGSLHTRQPASRGEIRARILVCHGALDPHVPTAHVEAFADEMTAADADWQLNVYGGALHGFTHAGGPQRPGVGYHAAADARSAQAIGALLAEVFEVRGR